MYEVFPILAGVAAAFLALRLTPSWRRWGMLVALAVVFGTIATLISGEFARSPGYLAIDIAQVLLTAIVTGAVLAWWERRATSVR